MNMCITSDKMLFAMCKKMLKIITDWTIWYEPVRAKVPALKPTCIFTKGPFFVYYVITF